ncbi:hypothetical protein [Blastopirellula marina]|uniref:Uncharacterized protein n=1 Tax=Blastopirellula marina TaxID=124 RepID=A0A2S8FWR4_9BACT|nr:hypothetical protein [Blastopirellula marina]PQO36622.1 hypothetical protein C5Y98_11545 [Blastopirellula marina]PTL44452.1 hypothetical protein C5Y97_11555 [Blastopirellula marina]
MTSDSQPENPFASPRIIDEEPVQAQLVGKRRLKRKKELAPTSVVMVMLLALALTPLVPLGFFFLGEAGVLVVAFNFVFSMLLLMKIPNTWWTGNLFYGALFASFVIGNLLYSDVVTMHYLGWSYLGMLTNAIVLLLFWLPSSRKYYFEKSS